MASVMGQREVACCTCRSLWISLRTLWLQGQPTPCSQVHAAAFTGLPCKSRDVCHCLASLQYQTAVGAASISGSLLHQVMAARCTPGLAGKGSQGWQQACGHQALLLSILSSCHVQRQSSYF